MAWYRRYRRSYRRPIRRTSRVMRQTRRFNRNMATVLQQRDVARFTVKMRVPIDIEVTRATNYANAVVSIWQVLATDPQFTAIKTLFDQVRINGVRVSANAIASISGSSAYFPVLAYAWDRNGTELFNTPPESQTTSQKEAIYKSICTYGSSRMMTLGASTRNAFATQLVAQDMQERITYINTDDMNLVVDNSQLGQNFFKPILAMSIYQPVALTGQDLTYKWEAEVAVDCTFRGARYSV